MKSIILVEGSLKRANLRGTDLSGADLSFVNFHESIYDLETIFDECIYTSGIETLSGNEIYSTLAQAGAMYIASGVNLRGSDLRNADLRGADLSEANLSNANLNGADLSQATLFQANLEGADLDYADLTDADLEQANLVNAQIRMTIFCNTTMPDGTVRDDGYVEAP